MSTCHFCAEDVPPAAVECPHCGSDLKQPPPRTSSGQDIGQNAGMRMLMPVGRSAWAIVAGYLGLLSLLGVFAPFALVTGIVAIYDIKKHPERHGMGRAVFGVVMGAACSLLFAIGLIASIVG